MNTRESLGDQETLDGLVSNTITEFIEDGIKKLQIYSFYNNENITKLELPNCSELDTRSLYKLKNLTELTLKFSVRHGGGSENLTDIPKLKHARFVGSTTGGYGFFRSFSLTTFQGTEITKGNGGIYVPDAILDDVRNGLGGLYNYRWCVYPLSEYPKTYFYTITDSWDDIINSTVDGSYAEKYKIGDTVPITIGDETMRAMLIGKNCETLTNGEGTASLTWLIANPFYEKHKYNDVDSYVDWSASSLRAYLNSEVFALLPSNLRSSIKDVNKSYVNIENGTVTTRVCSDKLYIPSLHELGCPNNSTWLSEDNAVLYGEFTNANASRFLYNKNGNIDAYLSRTPYKDGSSIASVAFNYPTGISTALNADTNLAIIFSI